MPRVHLVNGRLFRNRLQHGPQRPPRPAAAAPAPSSIASLPPVGPPGASHDRIRRLHGGGGRRRRSGRGRGGPWCGVGGDGRQQLSDGRELRRESRCAASCIAYTLLTDLLVNIHTYAIRVRMAVCMHCSVHSILCNTSRITVHCALYSMCDYMLCRQLILRCSMYGAHRRQLKCAQGS